MPNQHERKTIVGETRDALRSACMLAFAVAIICATPAHALPSFARQTGKPCATCHTVAYGPALTSYGRQFKLNGYVWGDAKQVIPP
ncbi:MAG: hypothetical protein M3O41_06495, partial [Pseudomonadota bacterium]|nr:hypothetical protein [Pseudomonadota bacterium]